MCVAAEGRLHLDTLCAAVHNAVFSLEVTVTEAIVVHEDDSIDKLLEIVCYHRLRQLLVRCSIEQIQQVWTIHQLPLQTVHLQTRGLCRATVTRMSNTWSFIRSHCKRSPLMRQRQLSFSSCSLSARCRSPCLVSQHHRSKSKVKHHAEITT